MPVVTKPIMLERSVQPSAEMTVWRFSFLDQAPAGGEVYRRFTDPRNIHVVRDTTSDLSVSPVWPAPLETFQLACVAEPGAVASKLKSWMSVPQDSPAVMTCVIETETGKLRWRPGRAVIEGPADESASLISALVEFSFFESELRRLEQAIVPHQASADRDVALAYNIRPADRSQWDRLYQTMEHLYQLRLQFARLEPNLYQSPRHLPAAERRVIDRLKARADIDARLEALNDRLETIEDLYEGAIDRITDYRNYRKGSLLEIAIVILLAVEVVLLLWHR